MFLKARVSHLTSTQLCMLSRTEDSKTHKQTATTRLAKPFKGGCSAVFEPMKMGELKINVIPGQSMQD